MEVKQLDPRSLEPWWNDKCEETYQLECQAKMRFEKEPSMEASKAFKKFRAQLKRRIAYAQRCYAHKVHMAEKYTREYPIAEEHMKFQEEVVTQDKKKKKKKKTAKDDVGTESEGDNLDLSQEIYPLSHYASNQEELVTQMFSSIRGAKLEAMLPPILKSIPLHELKSLCLHELRGMSKKRILCAITGEVMDGSSESEEEEEAEKNCVNSAECNENITTPSKGTLADENRNDSSGNQQGLPAYLMKTIKVESQDVDGSGEKNPSGGKSVLELLELQMRARIIKTMLEKGDDDGKPLTEDAIAALMGTAAQSVQDNDIVSAIKVEKDEDVSEVKGIKEPTKGESGKDTERKRKSGEGRQHRDDGNKHGRSSHKREHHRKRGSKRLISAEARDSDEDNEKKLRRGRSLEKRSPKKKKITRREFEERMKRAKKNRTYRQRKTSEDEEKTNASKGEDNSSKGEQLESEGKAKESIVENSNKKIVDGEVAPQKEEGEALLEKEEGEAVSEKEEGELDSDEEEEGACSPSDISSASYYSSSRSYTSRSRSRSYSRSWSRSPVRKKGGGHSRGRSRSRSWTRSRSRSRSTERRKKESSRWSKKSVRDHGGSGSVKMSSGIVSLPSSGNQKPPKEEEDNWGQSCDIEFVDSEEDFDDSAADATKNAVLNAKKPLPIKGQNADRASISFSFQKKTVTSINPNVDLDDLPLKSSSLSISEERKQSSDVEIVDRKQEVEQPEDIIDVARPKLISDEILISSDSEHEMKDPVKTKSVRVEKRGLTHSLKDGISITRKEASVYDKSGDTAKSNVISNPTTFQESNVKKNNKLADLVESKVEADQALDSKCDGDEKCNQDENTGVSAIAPINAGNTESGSIEADENQENQKTLTDGEKKDDGGDVQAKGICDCKTIAEIQESDDKKEGQSTEDRDFVSTETLDTRDGDVDDITQRSELCLDAGKGSTKETSLPKEDLQADPETKVANALLPKLDEVKVDITGHRGQDMHRPWIEAERSSRKNEESILISSESETDAEKEDLNIAMPNEKHTLDDPKEMKSPCQEKTKKSCKIANQKVVLEHLQESYNEEQDNNVPESSDINKEISTSNRDVYSVNPECSQKVSEEKKEVTEESTTIGTEQPNKRHPEGKLPEDQQVTVQGEEHDAQKSEEQRDDTQENNTNKSQASAEDFYRGVDQLTFSDDNVSNCDKLDVETTPNDREVEPIRINTGLIRRAVTRSRKKEMGAPEKSWTKKEKKKKEKPKDVLAMEGIGLLRKSLAESVQSPSKEAEESQTLQDSNEGKEANDQGNDEDTSTSWGISSVSSREETSIDSRVQSPKENTLQAVDTSPGIGNNDTSELQEHEGGKKKTGQKTEIIGIIEASSNPVVNQIDDIDLGGASWSMRWLQSEKVQKVVSSSKMLSRVRKKIQKKDKAIKIVPSTEKPVVVPKKVPEPVVPIIGSIEEYERLFGMKAKKSADEATNPAKESAEANIASGESAEQAAASTQDTQPPQKKCATFGSDDEGEDSEEEALWSKILGK